MAQYTQRTQPMHRHSKWLNKTFGKIGVHDPKCQTVCEAHVNPEFMKIIRAISCRQDLRSLSKDDPIPGPSSLAKPDKPVIKPIKSEKGSSREGKRSTEASKTPELARNLEFVSIKLENADDNDEAVETTSTTDKLAAQETDKFVSSEKAERTKTSIRTRRNKIIEESISEATEPIKMEFDSMEIHNDDITPEKIVTTYVLASPETANFVGSSRKAERTKISVANPRKKIIKANISKTAELADKMELVTVETFNDEAAPETSSADKLSVTETDIFIPSGKRLKLKQHKAVKKRPRLEVPVQDDKLAVTETDKFGPSSQQLRQYKAAIKRPRLEVPVQDAEAVTETVEFVPSAKGIRQYKGAIKRPSFEAPVQPTQAESNTLTSELIIKSDPEVFESTITPSIYCETVYVKEEKIYPEEETETTTGIIFEPSDVEVKSEEQIKNELLNPGDMDELPNPEDMDIVIDKKSEEPQPEGVEEQIKNELPNPEDMDIVIDKKSEEPQPEGVEEQIKNELPNPEDMDIVIDKKTEEPQPEGVAKDFQSIDELLNDLVEKKLINPTEMQYVAVATHNLDQHLLEYDMSYSPMSHSRLGAFMITLHMLYSYRAYDYILKHYKTCLPPTTTLRKWLRKLRGHSGFTKKTLEAINDKTKFSNSESKLVCLDLKEIKLHPSKAYPGPRQKGPINPIDWSEATANTVLVLTAVAVNADWKFPIGYFWTNVVKGSVRANLVQVAVMMLEKVGLNPIAVSYEYNADNLQMCAELTRTDDSHSKTSFFSESRKQIFLFPDPRGILEMLFANAKCIKYIVDEDLQSVSLYEILTLLRQHDNAPPITPQNVLRKAIASELYKFDCSSNSATARFFRNIHIVLDVLSCRTGAWYVKKVITSSHTKVEASVALQEARRYFASLRFNGSRISRFVLGLCGLIDTALMFISTHSSLPIQFSKFVASTYYLANLTPYGQNRQNPTALNFQKNYKEMLQLGAPNCQKVGKQLKLGNNNGIHLLICESSVDKINLTTYLHNGNTINHVKDDLGCLPSKNSEYEDLVMVYIARYITYNLARRLKCESCIRGLRAGKRVISFPTDKVKPFFAVNLEEPSTDLLDICKTAEAAFKKGLAHSQGHHIPQFSIKFLVIKVMKRYVNRPLFDGILYHQFETDGLYNHLVELVKVVAELYLETRIQRSK